MPERSVERLGRRRVLTAIAGVLGLSGCLGSPTDESSTSDEPPSTETVSPTPLTRTADGVRATFRVLDGHKPTDDTVRATFEASRVVVTGTMDPKNCRRPTLSNLEFDGDALRVVVGGEPRYPDEDVECGNASYDYRCVVSIDGEIPNRVDVVHDYHGDDAQTFTVKND
ncbi:hypothetical protein [Haloferax sp. YSSS75]|uniref:hypothetical protein n=1 Tax=Haloferax sp. YSSS75 TaxID=3388564 RepID=UPI00398D35AF